MKLIEYADSELLWMGLAHEIAGELSRMLGHADRASLAVPGGTTPGPVFDALSGLPLDWSRVDVLLTDERWVPEDSPRSNTRLLRERLRIDKAAAAHLIPLYGGTETPEESVATLADGVRAAMPFTFVLLGMGEDMHTASLFPRDEDLATALSPNAPALLPVRAPGAEEPRITLTAAAINGAMQKHMVILGDAKREALERAEALGDPMKAPVVAVLDDLTVHWARE